MRRPPSISVRTSSKLFGVLLRRLNGPEMAQVCLQEVYLKIWERAGEYSAHTSAPMTWMSSIARNQAIDLLRRRRREGLGKQRYEPAGLSGLELPAEARFALSSAHNRLDGCLRQMASEQRQLFARIPSRALAVKTSVGATWVRESAPIIVIGCWLARKAVPGPGNQAKLSSRCCSRRRSFTARQSWRAGGAQSHPPSPACRVNVRAIFR